MKLEIASIGIKQDEQGRYCLNDLHRAAGGEPKHKPSEWLRNKQTCELIEEVSKAGITAIQSKQQLGTFVAKELVYAYAMWISPTFHLKVIRTFDAAQTVPAIPQTLPEALRLAADLAEHNAILLPKAEAFDQIALADGTLSLTDAAKTIGVQPQKVFFPMLQRAKFIFRRAGGDHWIAYRTNSNRDYLSTR